MVLGKYDSTIVIRLCKCVFVFVVQILKVVCLLSPFSCLQLCVLPWLAVCGLCLSVMSGWCFGLIEVAGT